MMKKLLIMAFFVVLASFCLFLPKPALAIDQAAIDKLTLQIQQIQGQIDQYQQQINDNSSKAQTLGNEIAQLNEQIGKIQLEIKSLSISISQTNLEITGTQGQILDAQQKIELHKSALGEYLKAVDQIDRQNLTQILFNNNTLSDFFGNLQDLQNTQDKIQVAINDINSLKSDLETKKSDLEGKKGELLSLQDIQRQQQGNLNSNIKLKNQILQQTKGEEARYQKLVVASKRNLDQIKQQVFYLQQNGVSVEDAIKFGQIAANRAGIRPAFLIAILEVETGLGKNVGTGNWMDDMYKCYLRIGKPNRAEVEKQAFLKITSILGIDPDTVKVSREPNYGCGGAMGPAQFLASTWLVYADQVAQLTGHSPPNPWNIEDAFTASAIKLAKGGATSKDRAGEVAAAKAYISGSTTCTSKICNSYASAAENKAAIIEQNL